MDRLTTGRRHARAGSVTVNELLIKQAAPAPCSESSPPAREKHLDTAVIAPVAAEAVAHRRDEPRSVQLAKLATIGVATAVLCGAVAIASLVGQQRREVAHQPASRPTVRVTGEQALLPDQLDRSLPAAGETPAAPGPVPPPAAAPRTEHTHVEQTTARPQAPATTEGTSASSDTPVGAPTDLDLVREFYENLPGAPAAAFDLLSTELLQTSLGEFLDSWSLVTAIDDLKLVQRADGVLATVRMRLADGGHLRLQQLLTVAESPRRIVGVALLSAQRN